MEFKAAFTCSLVTDEKEKEGTVVGLEGEDSTCCKSAGVIGGCRLVTEEK